MSFSQTQLARCVRTRTGNPYPKKRRPIKQFKPFNFHDYKPDLCGADALLQGILTLGGDFVQEEEEVSKTPPPLSGRTHCETQTEIYVENIADDEGELKDAEIQYEPLFEDKISDDNIAGEVVEKKSEAEQKSKGKGGNDEEDKPETTSTGTQLDEWVFSDLASIFDQIAINLTEIVIMHSLKQLQEEYELEAIAKQREMYNELRERELTLIDKYKGASSKYDDQKKSLENRKSWDENIGDLVSQVGADQIQEDVSQYTTTVTTTDTSQEDKEIEEQSQTVLSEIEAEVTSKVSSVNEVHSIVDQLIEEVALRREAEYGASASISGEIDQDD